MKRRSFLALTAAAAAGIAWWRKPGDNGAPYTDYFRRLNAELKANGPMEPCLVIDLDRMDRNLDRVTQTLAKAGKHYRIVEKSLPSQDLIGYVAKRSGSDRLMSFHQPFLNLDARAFPGFDILLGKPLPTRAVAAFYAAHSGAFDPARQLQWLMDTPQRLSESLALAQSLGTRMRVNLEIDVGLHRGGITDTATLAQMLALIAEHPQQLEFSGFMGYDAHVGMGVPHILGSAPQLLARAMQRYREFVDAARSLQPALWNDRLTLNAGGSPSYPLHAQETLSTEISVGTALLKPTHYDLPTLVQHEPALFIATPVLKKTGPIQLPALDEKSRILSWWDPNQRETYFIYGGWWNADYEAPAGLQFNSLMGHSANQEIVNGSPLTGLQVDDQVFLRPHISEGTLLQFGDLLGVRGGRIVERWPVFRA